MQRRTTHEEEAWLSRWYPSVAGADGSALIKDVQRFWRADEYKIRATLGELRSSYGPQCARVDIDQRERVGGGDRRLLWREIDTLFRECVGQGASHEAVWRSCAAAYQEGATTEEAQEADAIRALRRIWWHVRTRHEMLQWALRVTPEERGKGREHTRMAGWRLDWDCGQDGPGVVGRAGGAPRSHPHITPSQVALRIMCRTGEFATGTGYAGRMLAGTRPTDQDHKKEVIHALHILVRGTQGQEDHGEDFTPAVALGWVVQAIQDYVESQSNYYHLVAQFFEVVVQRHWMGLNQATDPICADGLWYCWEGAMRTGQQARHRERTQGGLWRYIWAREPVGGPAIWPLEHWHHTVFDWQQGRPSQEQTDDPQEEADQGGVHGGYPGATSRRTRLDNRTSRRAGGERARRTARHADKGG